jgi:hypothetical protein
MCIISRGTALILLLLAVILHETTAPTMVPIWLMFLVLAISIYFATRAMEDRLSSSEDDEDALGYDFSQGYTSLERDSSQLHARHGTVQRWFIHLRRRWQQRQARREAEEDLRVDSILARLHSDGLQSLSPAERALLRRASARYRNRQSK